MIADDRGRPIKLRFRGVPIFARVKGHGIERRHRFYEVAWISPGIIVAAFILGILLFVARFTLLRNHLPAAIAAQFVGTLLLLWGPLGLISIVIAARATSGMCERVFARRDEQNRCRACTFSLAGLAAEPDGCTVCPECGAAWKLSGVEQQR